MTESDLQNKYSRCSMSDLRSRIMRRDEESDSAAYYLLRYKMIHALQWYYNQMRMKDELCDVLLDFYMYIRDGKNKSNERTYQTLEGLRSWWSFESFIERIFQRFLLDRCETEQKTNESERLFNHTPSSEYDKVRDMRIHCLGLLLVYVEEHMEPRNRFIFYRSLLSDLDKKQMISNEKMALAMDTSYSNYRQIDSRGRALAKLKLEEFEKGILPDMDDSGELLAERVVQEFESMNKILADLYHATLDKLDCKESIELLRIIDKESSGASFSLKGARPKFSRKDPNSISTQVRTTVEENTPSELETLIESSSNREQLLAKLKVYREEILRVNDNGGYRFRRRYYRPDAIMDFSDLNSKSNLWIKITRWIDNDLDLPWDD